MAYPLAAVVGGDIWLTANPSIALVSPESCTDSGDHTTYSASVHSFWDWTQTFTVQNSPNGSSGWATVTDYVMQWATGKIVFNTARSVGVNNFTRISAGSYFTATQVDASHSFSVQVQVMLKDTTPFQAAGSWQQNTGTIKKASGKIQTYRNDNRFFTELGNLNVIQLYLDKANNIRWQFFAEILNPDTTADVQSIEDQAVTFTSVRDVYFLTS